MSNEDFVSAAEIAKRLRVTKATVYRWIERGVIPGGIQIGSIRRLCWREVIAALRSAPPDAMPARPNPKLQPAAEGNR